MPIARAVEITDSKTDISKPAIVSFTEPEVDRGLYEMLECYGKDSSDPDVIEKVKFIQEALGDHPKDNLMHIITELGITPQGETKLRRVYRYLRLKQQADKALKHFETINKDLNFMRADRWA